MRVAAIVTLVVVGLAAVEACLRRRHHRPRPPRDTTKPVIHCPTVPPQNADKFQDNAVVTWEEPVIARDNRDGDITASRTGKAPGSLFSGTTNVSYSVRDRSGNYKSCSFTISVTVTTCPEWGPTPDGWKKCHTSDKMRRGSVCRFGCYQGHYLDPPNSARAECRDNGQWSIPAQPMCLKVTCLRLTPAISQVTIDCSDDNNYRSICTYSCATGYDVLPGFSKVRVCSAYGEWLGIVPQCVDTSPPEIQNCPYIHTAYAERSKVTGRVWWDAPEASDNDGHVTPLQTRGPAPGTELDVGEYDVTYSVSDAANNSAQCDFKVIVRQITCHTLYPLPYTSVLCPEGRRYGSFCNFTCDNGAVLNAHALAECQKAGDHPVAYGHWSFGDYQPYCELESLCPAKRAPDNGALPCDTWAHGSFCQTMCREGYIFNTQEGREFMGQLLICGDSGEWTPSADIPNCVQATPFEKMVYSLEARYYYSGNCEDVKDEIREKFIEILSGNPHCQPPDCSVENVKVICGDVTSRRKRSTDGDIAVSLDIKVKAQGGDAGLEAIQKKQILTGMVQDEHADHAFDIETSNGPLSPDTLAVSQADFSCPSGYEKNMKSFKCAECTVGHFYYATSGACEKCSRGKYQPDARQTTCLECPEAKTTEREAAISSDQCIDACTAGWFSVTSAQPCSPCEIGTYAEGFRTVSCTSCPGAQTTTTEGSKSRGDCHSFDIEFAEDAAEVVPATATVSSGGDVSELYCSFWVRCTRCDTMLTLTDAGGDNIVGIGGTGSLTVQLLSIHHTTDIPLPLATIWHNVQVHILNHGCEVTLDGARILSENSTYDTLASTNFTISIGGDGFRGSVSDMNIWTGDVAGVHEASTSCNGDVTHVAMGDLLPWRRFIDVTGSFILKRSTCDDFDNCLSSPCRNDGNCSDAIDGFHCACAVGYTGSMCQVNIDDCAAAPCDNGAPCVDGVASFTCACPYGYTGTLCETKVVDGSWFDWEQWSECSVTCGRGQRSRVRVCDEPLNGGMECEGTNHDGKECVEEECINECADDPTTIDHGALDCIWTDSTNETRRCSPSCDEGYDFDSDRFLDGITCGLETGYTWNIKNPDNPRNQLPECTEKRIAKTITMNYTGTYTDLVGNMGTDVDPNVRDKITSMVNGMVSAIDNIQTRKCRHTRTTVVNGGDEDENDARRRRAVDFVGFSVDITCVPRVIDECYDLLAAVATAIQEFVANSQLPVQIGDTIYNVDANSTYVDGIAECVQGNIPVLHYCIPCGTGSYQQGLFCKRCPRGTYQDRLEQTSCRECPEGWTTEGLQSRDVSMCNVEEPVAENLLVIVLPSVTGGLLIVVAVVITVIACNSKHSRIREMRSTVDIDTTSRTNSMSSSNQRFRSADMFAARPDSRVYPTHFDNNAYQHDVKQKRHSDVYGGVNVMSYNTMETEFGQTPDIDSKNAGATINTKEIYVTPYTPPPDYDEYW